MPTSAQVAAPLIRIDLGHLLFTDSSPVWHANWTLAFCPRFTYVLREPDFRHFSNQQ